MSKRLQLWMFGAMLLCASVRGDEPFRTFTDAQGRTFDGRITAFNSGTEVVTLQRADGKTGNMPISVFTEEDRRHIRGWGETNDFMNNLRISVRLVSEDISSEATKLIDVTKRVNQYLYRVELDNTAAVPLTPIKVEYCIFYRQGERDGGTVNYDEGICYGTRSVESLSPTDQAVFETKSIKLYSEGGYQTMFGQIDFSDADVRGIWLRLTTTLPNGEKMVRDYRTAQDDLWKWTPRSIGVGLNPGDSPYMLIIK